MELTKQELNAVLETNKQILISQLNMLSVIKSNVDALAAIDDTLARIKEILVTTQ